MKPATPAPAPPPAEGAPQDEGFISRWSRLKKESQTAAPPAPAKAPPQKTAAAPPLTDADMPPLDSLQEGGDLSPFLSEGVSDSLKRRAFRKIFMGERFNVRDGLDDYDEDFSNFAPLGDVITAEARRLKERREEMKRRKEAEAAEQEAQTPQQSQAQEEAQEETQAEESQAEQSAAPAQEAAPQKENAPAQTPANNEQ